MIQAERAAPRACDAAPATQDDQCAIITMCRQDRRFVRGLLGTQSDDALVIFERLRRSLTCRCTGPSVVASGSLKSVGATPYGRALISVFTTTSPVCWLK